MIIGIDLGTTNSLVACYDEGRPVVIPNRLGSHLTPSVVSIDEDEVIYVGETAKERLTTHPEMTASLFKRSMGSEKSFTLGNQAFKAEELSSFVLRSLKEDAEAFLGQEVEEAIISVPAYFNDIQRKATKKAGELTGLKVNRIINEPTAAAIAYGLHEKKEHTKFLVFDLGGGTLDISILEMYHNIMEVRAIAGDNYVGGEDFTDVLVRMMIHKNEIEESSISIKEWAYLKKQAELCKLGFSKNGTSTMKCVVGETAYEETFSSEAYEAACQLLLAKIRKPIEKTLRDAKVSLGEIDEVVLVGGATRLEIVRRFVGRLFGKIPNTNANPDEVVAMGAALQCGMKARNQEIKEIVLTEVCPFTLGTSVVMRQIGNIPDSGHFLPIIERNTVIPVSRTETFYTASDNQKKINVDILQGESRFAKNNLLLGEISIAVPPGKEGQESIDVTYTYDVNSILEVKVKVNSTGAEKKVIIQKDGTQISKEEAEQRMEELNYLKIHPREQEENKLLIFKGERLYEEATGEIRQEIGMILAEFDGILNKQDKDRIEEARADLKHYLEDVESAMHQELFDS